ncbi:unnamed protein product, partial [Ectocarpus fasciculatus]
ERKKEPFGPTNVVTVLSEQSVLLASGKLRILSCGCKPESAAVHRCRSRCKCGQEKRACIPVHCGCKLACESAAVTRNDACETAERDGGTPGDTPSITAGDTPGRATDNTGDTGGDETGRT